MSPTGRTPPPNAPRNSTRNSAPTLLAALALLALYAWMVAPGLGTTSDSRHYLGTALHLRQGLGWLDVDGQPYRFWGPLFPLLLAGCRSALGLKLLHGAALLGQLLLWSQAARWLLPPPRARWLPPLLALSTAVLVPAKFVWAETVFGLLAAGFLVGLLGWLPQGLRGFSTRQVEGSSWLTSRVENPRNHTRSTRGEAGASRCKLNGFRWLLLAAGCGALLPLQRTSGVFLLMGAGLGLLLAGAAPRWRCWLPLLALALAPALAWNYYAEALAGPPVYQAVGGGGKLLASAADYGFVLLRWLLPLGAQGWRDAAPLLWAALLPLLLAALWPRPGNAPGLRLLWAAVLVNVAAHLIATNLARGAAGLHDTERYLAAVAGPVLLLVLSRWPAHWGARLLLAAWLLYSGIRVGHNAWRLRSRIDQVYFSQRFAEEGAEVR